jgi:hypothetical protein
MSKLRNIWIVGVLACMVSLAGAQDESTQPSGQSQEPAPASDQQNGAPSASENPPLTSLDLPSLEPHAAPLSYLQAGATFAETADSNPTSTLGGGRHWTSVTRALGSLTLRRVWSHYDLGLDYSGGAAHYATSKVGLKDMQQMGLAQKISWKRGQLALYDSFSYLPEGNFGGAYGSLGSEGIHFGSSFSSFWGGTALGGLGQAPRILNLGLAEVEQYLSPKSAITATAGYALLHFYGSDVATGTPFIGSSETTAQVGYNRMLTPKTQVAVAYAHQAFDFSVYGSSFHNHVIQGVYGHPVSGRMDLLLSAGPQITFIRVPGYVCSDPSLPDLLCTLGGGTLISTTVRDTRIGVAGRGRLRYKLTRTYLDLTLERFETGGSGLFAGAETNLGRLTATRVLTRTYNLAMDIGYSRNSRLQAAGAPASTYDSGFAGAALHRNFGRSLHGFVSYQFNEIAFDSSYCGKASSCNRISNRELVSIGLDWMPRPIRID